MTAHQGNVTEPGTTWIDDIGIGVGGNITYLLAQLQALQERSPELYNQLRTILGISPGEKLEEWVKKEPDKMHVRSYEKQMMQYEEFRVHKTLLLYLPPILIILGTFGNVFSFIILKRKAMLKFSTYFYLMVLAIADTLVLYVGLLRLWIGELTGFDLKDQADWLCKLNSVVGYTVSDFSVWLIIAVTIERYIVVCHPLKANAMCNTQRARKVIIALFAGMFLVNIHFFWTVQLNYRTLNEEKIAVCEGGSNHDHLVNVIWPYVDIMLYSLLPFLVILVLNILIIRQVVLARRHRSELRNDNMYDHAQRRPSHEGSTRLTIMLLTISFAFLLTTLPLGVLNIGANFWNKSYSKDLEQMSKLILFRTISHLLMFSNHAMNFFLYCATGQKFRHQLIWMICYAKRTYNGAANTWVSEQSQATRMETLKSSRVSVNHIFSTTRRAETSEPYSCSAKNDMYMPLKGCSESSRN